MDRAGNIGTIPGFTFHFHNFHNVVSPGPSLTRAIRRALREWRDEEASAGRFYRAPRHPYYERKEEQPGWFAALVAALPAIALVVLIVLLTGCCDTKYITKPVAVPHETIKVESVPNALTEPNPIPDGALAECPDVAKQRKAALESCNADKAAIRARHGEKDSQ